MLGSFGCYLVYIVWFCWGCGCVVWSGSLVGVLGWRCDWWNWLCWCSVFWFVSWICGIVGCWVYRWSYVCWYLLCGCWMVCIGWRYGCRIVVLVCCCILGWCVWCFCFGCLFGSVGYWRMRWCCCFSGWWRYGGIGGWLVWLGLLNRFCCGCVRFVVRIVWCRLGWGLIWLFWLVWG